MSCLRSVYCTLAAYILIFVVIVSQRFVNVYTAAVWFDCLSQLSTSFLPVEAKRELIEAFDGNPEMMATIRAASVATGVLHALLPRSTAWKFSLFAATKLLILVAMVEQACFAGSLNPLISLARDACAPFLLAFGAAELLQRRVQGKAMYV